MIPPTSQLSGDSADPVPKPRAESLPWLRGLRKRFRLDPDDRWGSTFLRIASDFLIVCDESLNISHHNRAFLKAVGHNQGTFGGQSLLAFFPRAERDMVTGLFHEWRRGHAAGMRFRVPILTTRGARSYEIRVVRCRGSKGAYHYYLVGRDAPTERGTHPDQESGEAEAFFQGLPVAAWRTDDALRITKVYGNLWPELGAASEDLIGEAFGRRHYTLLPELLRGIDCSSALMGMHIRAEVKGDAGRYSVTVEPFLDGEGRVVGTVGLLRRAKVGKVILPDPIVASETMGRHHQLPSDGGASASVLTGRVPRYFESGETTG